MDFEFVVIDKEQVIGGLMVKLSWVKAPAHFEIANTPKCIPNERLMSVLSDENASAFSGVHYLYGESIVFY
jgi:hypothetical protein